jgi:hypothetical protein
MWFSSLHFFFILGLLFCDRLKIEFYLKKAQRICKIPRLVSPAFSDGQGMITVDSVTRAFPF